MVAVSAAAGCVPVMTLYSAMYAHGMTLIRATLLLLSGVLIFIPESRHTAVSSVLLIFFVVAAFSSVWRLHRKGLLGMTPKQIYRMPNKPSANLLETASLLMSVVAMTVSLF